MPPTSNDTNQDLLTRCSSLIATINGMIPKLATTGSSEDWIELEDQVFNLSKLHKILASRQCAAKVLIALHDGPNGSLAKMSVLTASVPLRIFTVDHRSGVARSVEVETTPGTATDQDFCEAVYDEIAEFILDPCNLSSDLKRIIEQLKS